MKNLYLLLALFFIIPRTMEGNFINNKTDTTILITDDLMICRSYFEPVHDRPVHYFKPLKMGKNEHQFIPFTGMSVKVIVTKY